MLSESFIDELKYRSDIQNTISSYVNLKKQGRISKGLCPFHSERTPSFTVYHDSQSFFCFGCGAGGDVVTFIKRVENLEYMDALRFLAQKCGINFPEMDDNDNSANLRRQILEANREAARFYHEKLKSKDGEAALSYLKDRGLHNKTIAKFGLGYASGKWDELYLHLKSKGFSEYLINSAYLVGKNKNNKNYDIFRERIMFPIIDLRGNVIAFGGRNLGEYGPKYLNSSDTPAYKKSRNLYALQTAKNSKENRLILAEGYMDVIAMHQAGFTEAVATLGTALTSEQARIVANYATEVVIAYDSDEAGQKATQKAIRLLEETGVNIKVLELDGAKDPDEYIKKFGAERFNLLIGKSATGTDYEIEKLKAKYNLKTNEGKINFIKEFTAFVAQMQSPVEKDIYISKISEELSVDKEALKEQINSATKRRISQKKFRENRSLKLFAENTEKYTGDPQRGKYIKYAIAEDKLMTALMRHPDYFNAVSEIIIPEDFVTDNNKRIFTLIYKRLKAGQSAQLIYLSAELEDREISHLSKLLANDTNFDISKEQAIEFAELIKSFDDFVDNDAILNKTDEEILNYIQGLKK